MIITLNGKKEEIPEGITILKLLEIKKIRPEVVTVELNENIIEKDKFSTTLLNQDDQAEFVYYMGGGGSTQPPKAASLTIMDNLLKEEERYAFFR